MIKAFPMISPPAQSTIHAVLDRNGLVKRRKRRRYKAKGTSLTDAQALNELWCADYKGEFKLGNRKYCYPLTITDYRSRYLLACEALDSDPPVTLGQRTVGADEAFLGLMGSKQIPVMVNLFPVPNFLQWLL